MIEVFLGINESEELSTLGQIAQKRGAIVGNDFAELLPKLNLLLQSHPDSHVVISGGLLAECIPNLAEQLLQRQVPTIIPVRHCRVFPNDRGDNVSREVLQTRERIFLSSLYPNLRQSSLLIIE